MDVNRSLFWLISLSAALLAFRTISQRPRPRGWCTVLILFALGLAAGAAWLPDSIGYYAAAAWCLLVLTPLLGQRFAVQLAATRHARLARILARLAVLLHPADGWPVSRQFVDALVALQQGRDAEAEILLNRLENLRTPLGRTALALNCRRRQDWHGFLNWIHQVPQRDLLLTDGSLLDLYLQALGEIGRPSAMLHEYAKRLQGQFHPTAQLRVAALAGDARIVNQLLAGPLDSWPADVGEYWRSVALLTAGHVEQAAQSLNRLAAAPNALIARFARDRLQYPQPPAEPSALDAAAAHTLAGIRKDVDHDARYAVMSSTPYRRPIVTLLLAILITGNFLRELPQGAENLDNLIDLGAIVVPSRPLPNFPDAPRFDQWWRPFTAAALHFGWAHFLMNLFALLYLGGRLERAWGHALMLICFVASILCSMSLTAWLLESQAESLQILAGASGGIMGLLGGMLGYLAVGRWRRPTPLINRQLGMLFSFVAIQTLFDVTHVEVSQQAHLIGLATGALFGLVVGILPISPAANPRPAASDSRLGLVPS